MKKPFKILDRYVILEMFEPFVFGLAIFTILFFAGSHLFIVTQMVAEGKSSIGIALKYALNSLPAIFVFTFPMAVLLGALISFGRLSGESELVAMRAGGISFFRIAIPAILLSFLIALGAVYLNNYIAPQSTYIANGIFLENYVGKTAGLAENMVIRNVQSDGTESLIFFKRLFPAENRMEDITIQYFKAGKRIRELFAYDAVYRPEESKWYLKDATIHEFDENQEPSYISSNATVEMPLNLSPQQLAERSRRPEEMDRKMLRAEIDRMKAAGFEDEKALKKYYQYEVIYHQKIAIPFTCFVFGLFGIPLGVRPHRSSKAMGLGLSIIFIFVYYTLMSVGTSLGQNGRIDAFWAAWTPNLIFAIAGVILIIQQIRE